LFQDPLSFVSRLSLVSLAAYEQLSQWIGLFDDGPPASPPGQRITGTAFRPSLYSQNRSGWLNKFGLENDSDPLIVDGDLVCVIAH
jgi:hypothetical protein